MKTYLLSLMLCAFCIANYFSQTTITVGATGDYSTIFNAYNSCTSATNYIIEIQSDYVQESLPIVLGNLSNKSAVNNVIIRPSIGITSLDFLNTGTENDIFDIDGANYLTIDGRPGGIGSSVMTIENNQTSKGHAIKIEGDVSYLNLNYLTILGSNQTTSVGYSSTHAGVLMIGEEFGGVLSEISISNCTIGKSTGGIATYLVTSYSNSGNISSINISNCELKDAYRSYVIFSTNSTDCSISDNHFYQTTDFTPTLGSTFSFVKFIDGGNYYVTDNYFGGTGINCSGSSFIVNSSNAKSHLLSFSSSINGTCYITGNYFQNIDFTTTNTTDNSFSITSIEGGSADYIIGSNGAGNTIGSSSGTGNIVITDNGSTTSMTASLFYSATNSDIEISYNSIGGLTFNGTNTAGNISTFYTTSSEDLTFTFNQIGNSTSNNIVDNVSRTGTVYLGGKHSSSNGVNFSSNTFQNTNLNQNSSGYFYILESTSATNAVIESNTVTNLHCTRNSLVDLFYLNILGESSVNDNTISNLTLDGTAVQFYGFDLTSSSNSITCTGNTIGSSTENNILISGDLSHYLFYISIPTANTANISNNTIQEIYLDNTGTGNRLYNFYLEGTGNLNFSSNHIEHILSESTATGNGIIGIYQRNTGSGNIIANNRINDWLINTTTAVSTRFVGLYLFAANSGGTNEKNRIINLATKATNSPTSYGIYSSGSNSAWTHKNNVVLLDNELNTNSNKIMGLRNDASGTTNVYHNTIKISGTASSGSDYSIAFLDNAANGTVREFYNNLLFNDRTGGTGTHYGFWNVGSTNVTSDYNYIEAVANKWNSTTYTDFNDYQTNSGSSNDITGTITIDALGGVSSGSGSISGAGTDLVTPLKVTDDLDGNARSITPWIGAFEVAQPLPVILINFKGNLSKNREVELKWLVENDWKDYLFEIDRSEDGSTFKNIYKLFNQIGTTNYSYTAEIGKSTLIYYRLSILNVELNLVDQKIISVDIEKSEIKLEEQYDLLGNKLNSEKSNQVVLEYYADGSVVKKVIMEK